MQIEHPSAKMIVEVAKTQENEVGDGTTTAVVVAGELLKNAERLLEQNIHSTVIAKGYRMAADRSQEILRSIGEKVTEKDDKLLKQVAMTAMTGKGAESSKELLATLVIKAVKRIVEKEEKGLYIDINNVKVEAKVGSGVEDSEMIEGVVLDKEKVHAAMPRVVKGAKVAIIDSAMEVKGTEADTKISVSDPQQFQAFIDQEEKMLRDMVDKVTSTGATVVFCQKGIDDMAQHFLAKRGVFAVRRVKKSDVENLSRATGANIITNLHDLTSKDLGFAGTVEEVKVGDENMVFVRECKNPKAVTLLLRGGTSHVVDEIKRAVTDAIGDVASALKSGSIVAGAGAPEMEVARQLKKFADTLSGREQLAVLAFAEAIEVIPRTLAENAGLDPIDVLTELRAAHDQKNKWAGINVFTGKVMDAWKAGVLEPLKIKTQAIKSASEVAVMILRIDDVIAGSSHGGGGPDMMPPGGMGGMPGMM